MTRYNVRRLRCDSAAALRQEMLALGADARGVAIMVPKGQLWVLKAEKLGFAAASILKQELLSKGGDAALCGEVYHGGEHTSDALIVATERALRRVLNTLRVQPLPSLQQLAAEIAAALDAMADERAATLTLRGRTFAWGTRTYVMGILNVTPDSFSGDGLLRDGQPPLETIVARALAMVEQGADILDVGGMSTRPGSVPVEAEEELARVVPVIRALRQATEMPLSVDTYRARVARAALEAGADLVNDVWGLQMDAEMGPLVAGAGVPVVLMHNHSKPKDAAQEARLGGRYVSSHYDDLLAEVVREMRALVEQAEGLGIARERIIVDPGIGFGKTVEQNLRLLNHLDELRVLGLPILLGPSRKSFIGYTLDVPPEERLEGTAAAVAVGIVRGADIVRVHDVCEMARVARMTDAILRSG